MRILLVGCLNGRRPTDILGGREELAPIKSLFLQLVFVDYTHTTTLISLPESRVPPSGNWFHVTGCSGGVGKLYFDRIAGSGIFGRGVLESYWEKVIAEL